MVVSPVTVFALLLVFGICAVDRALCTIILMSATDQKGSMVVINDMNVPVTVEGPGLGVTDVPQGKEKNLYFQGYGKVTVRENGNEIFTSSISNGKFNAVRTHSRADATKVVGDIIISQKADHLSLVLNGGNNKHGLALDQSKYQTKQSISLGNNQISITQSSEQKNQNLAFTGQLESVALTQDGPTDNQSLSFSGRGSHSLLIHQSNGVTLINQTF